MSDGRFCTYTKPAVGTELTRYDFWIQITSFVIDVIRWVCFKASKNDIGTGIFLNFHLTRPMSPSSHSMKQLIARSAAKRLELLVPYWLTSTDCSHRKSEQSASMKNPPTKAYLLLSIVLVMFSDARYARI